MTDRGYVCPRHGRFVHKGEECPHCEPVSIKAAAPRPAIVTEAAFTPIGLVPPPLKKHYVVATGYHADFTYSYLCTCGYAAKFPEMAAHLQSGNASNASAASAAPKDLP